MIHLMTSEGEMGYNFNVQIINGKPYLETMPQGNEPWEHFVAQREAIEENRKAAEAHDPTPAEEAYCLGNPADMFYRAAHCAKLSREIEAQAQQAQEEVKQRWEEVRRLGIGRCMWPAGHKTIVLPCPRVEANGKRAAPGEGQPIPGCVDTPNVPHKCANADGTIGEED